MHPERTERFSDAVFAIAITLLVLGIHPPKPSHRMPQELLDLWPSYVGYLLSFAFIGFVWASHHTVFRAIHHVNRGVLWINILYLMVVAFLPFPSGVLARTLAKNTGEDVGVTLYGSTAVVSGILYAALWGYCRRHGLLMPGVTDDIARSLQRRVTVYPAALAAATAVGLVFPVAALVGFGLVILLYARGSAATRVIEGLVRERRPERPNI